MSNKISVRSNSEEEAIKQVKDFLKKENILNIDIERINLRFDGNNQIYDIYYNYDKNINYEIERKFLVKDDSIKLNYNSKLIIQNYISFNPVCRIRKVGNKYYYTKKGYGKLVRSEEEKEIDEETYLKLYDYRVGNEIRKIRYYIPLDNGYNAELDIYMNNLSGLKTVEVEFPSFDDALNFNPPTWFGEDITMDERYKNNNLALLKPHEINELIIHKPTRHL